MCIFLFTMFVEGFRISIIIDELGISNTNSLFSYRISDITTSVSNSYYFLYNSCYNFIEESR